MVRRIPDFHHSLPPDAAASLTACSYIHLTLAFLVPVSAALHSALDADNTRTATAKDSDLSCLVKATNGYVVQLVRCIMRPQPRIGHATPRY
jgi:hypothetical protein